MNLSCKLQVVLIIKLIAVEDIIFYFLILTRDIFRSGLDSRLQEIERFKGWDYIKFANIFWQTYKLPNYILPTFILPTLHFT